MQPIILILPLHSVFVEEHTGLLPGGDNVAFEFLIFNH